MTLIYFYKKINTLNILNEFLACNETKDGQDLGAEHECEVEINKKMTRIKAVGQVSRVGLWKLLCSVNNSSGWGPQ